MNFEYFDIHSHIYFPDFDADRLEVISEMKKRGIGTITIGTGFESSKQCVELAEKNDNIFACIGQHPEEIKTDSVFDERLVSLADNSRVVAIGECGLDYFRLSPDDTQLKIIQKVIFEKHIDLALSKNLPLMLHVRNSKGTQDAYNDSLDILESFSKINGTKLLGNAHFFAGDSNVLKRLLTIGFTVSFTGVLTFTHDYDEIVRATPIEMIMSETDSPFVAPVPYRGKRNSPLYVPEVVKKIAEIRGEPLDTVKKAIISNVLRHFPRIK
jgi:TatD DNase family protein